MSEQINFCPCCGTNLNAVKLALGFVSNGGQIQQKAKRNKRRRLTDDDRKTIQTLSKSGDGPSSIARQTGISVSTVRKVLDL